MLALKAASALRPKRAEKPGQRSSWRSHVATVPPKRQAAICNCFAGPQSVDVDLNWADSRLGSLDRFRSFSADLRNRFAVRNTGRRVILGILVVIIFRQRSIDKVQNHARDIHLAAVKELKRFLSQPRRSVGEPDDKKGGVDFRSQTRRVVSR